MGGALGSLVQRSLQIEAALQLGFEVRLSDVTAEEFACVAILKEERLKREAEQAKQNAQ
jgi:hypothetical protein